MVYAEPTLRPAMESVSSIWRSRTGVGIHVFAASTELSLAQIERGARCDMIVALAGPALEDAKSRNVIDSETATPLLRNSLVLVGRDSAAVIGSQGSGALVMLLSGKRLAIADPSRDAAGRYGIEALRHAGSTVDSAAQDLAVAESSAGVLTLLEANRADYGIVYASDAGRSGLKDIMHLAGSLHPPIDYVAVQTADPQGDPDEFFEFLQSNEVRAIFQAAGLQWIGEEGTE